MNSFFSRNKILTALTLLFIVFVGLLFWIKNSNDISLNEKNLENQDSPSSDENDQENSLLNQVKTPDDHLLTANALMTGESAACEPILDAALKKTCLENFVYVEALQENTETACQNIELPELKTACLDKTHFKMALKSKEIASCEKISEENLKLNCLNQLKGLLAKGTGNLETCNTITSPSLKLDCLDDVFLIQAAQAQNIKLCDKLSSTIPQNHCRGAVEQNSKVIEAGKESMEKKLSS